MEADKRDKTFCDWGIEDMIQDITPHVFHNENRKDAKCRETDYIVLYQDGKFLVSTDDSAGWIVLPTAADFGDALPAQLIYLFEVDGQAFFAPLSTDSVNTSFLTGRHFVFSSLRDVRSAGFEPKTVVFALFTAYHLLEWYRSTRYCGACGGRMTPDDTERAMYCPACRRKVYPRINPAVIIGVINGDRLLLTRYRNGMMNALVAGFTEIGETFEETVAREVMEETGLRVRHIRYYKSQPWGIAADILAGYYCEVDGDDTIRMDDTELRYAEWVPRAMIELQPQPYSLTNEMMEQFKLGRIRAVEE